MTDDVGMFQHARFDIPNRSFGYCTDDVARALIVAIEATRDRATEADRREARHDVPRVSVRRAAARRLVPQLHGLRPALARSARHPRFVRPRRVGPRSLHRPRAARCVAPRRARAVRRRAAARRAARRICARGRTRALGLAAVAAAEPGDAQHHRRAARRGRADRGRVSRARPAPDWRWCEDDDDLRQRAALRSADSRGRRARRSRAAARRPRDARLLRAASSSKTACSCRSATTAGIRAAANARASVSNRWKLRRWLSAALAACDATGDARYRDLATIAGDWYFGRNTHGFLDGHERRLPRRHRPQRRQPEHGRRVDARVSHERDRARRLATTTPAHRALAIHVA